MAHTADEIQIILGQFDTPGDKLSALKLLKENEAPDVPDPRVAELEEWLDRNGHEGKGVPLGDRVSALLTALVDSYPQNFDRSIYANMAWSLGYDDSEHVTRSRPQGPTDEPVRFEIPGGAKTNSCDEARMAWRDAALTVAKLVKAVHDAGQLGSPAPDADHAPAVRLSIAVAHMLTGASVSSAENAVAAS